jgi:hypothetical protein
MDCRRNGCAAETAAPEKLAVEEKASGEKVAANRETT